MIMTANSTPLLALYEEARLIIERKILPRFLHPTTILQERTLSVDHDQNATAIFGTFASTAGV
jgi:hypothetical protein